MDCDLADGQILSPQDIRACARQCWKQSGDPQEVLAAQIGRSQASVSRALRTDAGSDTRYVKVCVDVIEHYCDDVAIRYPTGTVERSS